jgi:hypothetical protein
MYIPYYIHLNALDFSMPEWRQGKVRSTTNALKTLQRYRWSSHLDYLGENNFPSITERECLARIIGTKQRYKKEIARIITDPDLASVGESIE